MAFTGYDIFPGLTVKGIVSPSIQELIISFNLDAIDALQKVPSADLEWADMAGVTPAYFEGKVPLDFTALDGFEPFKGVRTYKQIDVIAIQAEVNQWQRNVEWDIRIDQSGNAQLKQVYNTANLASNIVQHARVMKARLAATAFMQGTPTTNKAQVYTGNSIPGAGLSLFNTLHYANPMDPNSRKFSNYNAAFGQFTNDSFATVRKNMRTIPSPALSAEVLGLQVTDIIGPSFMEEPFRKVALQQLALQIGTGTATGAVGATTNIYAKGTTPWQFWIAPQLDADPYVAANAGKHMFIAVSRTLPGVHPIEMVAPTKEFTPMLQFFGDGTEMAAMTRKVHLLGDLDAGVAAGLPHCCARYEET